MNRSIRSKQERKAIGLRLRQVIIDHSLSVEEISQQTGLTTAQIYDRMKLGNLRLNEATELCRVLEIDLQWLATGYEPIPYIEGVTHKLTELSRTKPEFVNHLLLAIDRLWHEERVGKRL
ncbi:helix-turn-helix domain-containing protein [Zooshikella marina]|uniref:helix-turn-helix domain-containing protein n=1 Tax=Zooshikella ganghwensis TaxID=202772 RepID=UPI001BAF8661|nr:helix-turn-helix transcriptional regulator [Zooshikella ganghwensis]MBU2707962.1 helix-turn-helix domain-containing protein [Zooshikella ganghwensis]